MTENPVNPELSGDDDAEFANAEAAEAVAARLAELDDDLADKRADALIAGLAAYDLDDDDLELLEGAELGEDGIITMPAGRTSARARSSTASSAAVRPSWRTPPV